MLYYPFLLKGLYPIRVMSNFNFFLMGGGGTPSTPPPPPPLHWQPSYHSYNKKKCGWGTPPPRDISSTNPSTLCSIFFGKIEHKNYICRNIYIFLLKELSRFWSQFFSTALVIGTFLCQILLCTEAGFGIHAHTRNYTQFFKIRFVLAGGGFLFLKYPPRE